MKPHCLQALTPSRIWRNTLPFGNTARAIHAISSGMAGTGSGCMDIGFFLCFSWLFSSFRLSCFFSVLLAAFANTIFVGLYRRRLARYGSRVSIPLEKLFLRPLHFQEE